MKLTNNILHALRGRKRDTEEARIPALLEAALPAEADEEKKAELKLGEFKKEIAGLIADQKKITALNLKFEDKHRKLEEQIKRKLGSDFCWNIQRGVQRSYRWNKPGEVANSALSNIIDSALVDLQLDCLGLQDEALKAAIAAFNTKPMAEQAVKEAVARLKAK